VGAFFRFLVRLLFVIVVGVLIGLGLFYGVPWLYRQLVLPVQEQGTRITALEEQWNQAQDQSRTENKRLQDRLTALEEQVTQLKEEHASQVQAQADLKQRLEGQETRLAQLEKDLAAQTATLTTLRDTLRQETASWQTGRESAAAQLNALEGRLALLQAAHDLLKVRLLLLEENPGAARLAVALAVAHLDQASTWLPDQASALALLRQRAVELDGLIAERSFRVGADLETLWSAVVELTVPGAAAAGFLTPTVTVTPTLGAPAVLTPTVTPAP
jgi:cell division protein FtsB